MKFSRVFTFNYLLFLVLFSMISLPLHAGMDWEKVDPESQGFDPAKLQKAVDYLKAHSGKDGVNELVIIQNNALLWKGPKIDRQHGVWSMTKSFTSTVLGLLIDEGKCSLDTKAMDIMPAMAETYPNVTLRHFTTMTSGYRAKGDKTSGNYTHGPSKTPFIPSPNPLFTPPGSKYAYWDSAMNQFANILTKIAGEKLEIYFKRKIADPIGMDREHWDWGEFVVEDWINVNGGSGNNNRHMFITAREAAKFGLLFLRQGKWNGEQLISKEWIEQACSVQVSNDVPLADPKLSSADGPGVYGFNWWVNGIHTDGTRKWPGCPLGMFAASGYNNNDLFVIPEEKMVIARLGLDQGDHRITDGEYAEFIQKVIASKIKK